LDCINHASHETLKITLQILNSCWKVTWPECICDKHLTNQRSSIITAIYYFSHKIDGKGLDILEAIDVENILEDKGLGESEILQIMLYPAEFEIPENYNEAEEEHVTNTTMLIRESFQIVSKLKIIFLKLTLIMNEFLNFNVNSNCVFCVTESLKGISKPTQTLINDYINKE